MSDVNQLHLRLMEALLFASANPIPEPVMAERLPDGADIPELLETLQEHYKGRGVHLVKVNKAWAFRTAPDLGPQLIVEREVTRKLSRAAVETLAIIAYHQPITRAEIEEIRGISLSRGTIDILLELGWIKPRGRRRTPGRPLTWGTSPAFLDHFGLADLSDLPGVDDLKSAGLLRKGQVIGGLTDSVDDDDHEPFDETGGEGDPDLLEEAFLEAEGGFGEDGEEEVLQDA